MTWRPNEPVAIARQCELLIQKSDGSLAPRATDFMALGYVYFVGADAPHAVLALGTMTNVRRPRVFADDAVTAVDTGADSLELIGHDYETGDGPLEANEVIGPISIGEDIYVIVDDEDNIGVATSLANAYAGTRVALTGTETGAILSDNPGAYRGIDGHFTYEATQAETLHGAKRSVVIVDGTDYERHLGFGGMTIVDMESGILDAIIEGDKTVADALRAVLRGEVGDYEKDGDTYDIKKLDGTTSHRGTITESGRTVEIVDLGP